MLISPLKTRRAALGITRAELAIIVGVTVQSVGLYERAEALPVSGTLKRLARALHRDPEELETELVKFRNTVRQHLKARVTNLSAVLAE